MEVERGRRSIRNELEEGCCIAKRCGMANMSHGEQKNAKLGDEKGVVESSVQAIKQHKPFKFYLR